MGVRLMMDAPKERRSGRRSPIGSLEEQSVGRLRVVEAGRATCTAISSGTAFHLPEGARGRLLKPGESERLRVVLKPDDASLSSEIGQSPLLEIVSEGPADRKSGLWGGGGE